MGRSRRWVSFGVSVVKDQDCPSVSRATARRAGHRYGEPDQGARRPHVLWRWQPLTVRLSPTASPLDRAAHDRMYSRDTGGLIECPGTPPSSTSTSAPACALLGLRPARARPKWRNPSA